jgi:hypothetical protein
MIENLIFGTLIIHQQSSISNCLRRVKRPEITYAGENSLPPAASPSQEKKEKHHASCKTRNQTPRQA